MNEKNDSFYVGIPEAAKRTGLSAYALRQACKAGELKHLRVGRVFKVYLPELLPEMRKGVSE